MRKWSIWAEYLYRSRRIRVISGRFLEKPWDRTRKEHPDPPDQGRDAECEEVTRFQVSGFRKDKTGSQPPETW
jgi:hypothetical protein